MATITRDKDGRDITKIKECMDRPAYPQKRSYRRYNTMKEIDSDKLAFIIADSGYTFTEASRIIGACDSYISNALGTGKMSRKFTNIFCEKFGVQPESFVTEETPAEAQKDPQEDAFAIFCNDMIDAWTRLRDNLREVE